MEHKPTRNTLFSHSINDFMIAVIAMFILGVGIGAGVVLTIAKVVT